MYMFCYLKYLYLLFTRPIVQHPLSIAFVAPVMLLLPDTDDGVATDPLVEGITATKGDKRNNNTKWLNGKITSNVIAQHLKF